MGCVTVDASVVPDIQDQIDISVDDLKNILISACGVLFSSCSESGPSIAVPNDTTNEARALLLLEDNGITSRWY